MFKNMKLGTKIMIGFGVLIVIAWRWEGWRSEDEGRRRHHHAGQGVRAGSRVANNWSAIRRTMYAIRGMLHGERSF